MGAEARSSTGKYIAIGCMTIVLLLVIGGYLAYKAFVGVVQDAAEEYTSTELRELPAIPVSAEESVEVLARLDEFTSALKEGRVAGPLELTGLEINQILSYHADWEQISNFIYVRIEEDRIGGEISVPLDAFAEVFGDFLIGRYLNGSAQFTIQLNAGRLFVFLESLEVNGKTVPEEIMQQVRKENWFKNTNNNPELDEAIAKLESISVQDGKLRIVAK